MGKLVRDRIPELIYARGDRPMTRVLDDPGYEAALLAKVVEEAEELRDTTPEGRLEEAADVYEVLLALARHLGLSLEDVARRAELKRAERGGFDRRVWLES
ncbi:nucleoside triphosphate pyrophosphohydrolase [Nocardioides sp. WL0053]|uniref:Nucleoside triphosphate pyrophosphohydrolase n=1 Tax=Nocardioides jiangsuensis TaxID=2866161 RepID=A0ABS7RLX2_9ACTN|nr:nucleoside triphosphate pyrophosphohydrolase [Nocardioides jiangsuensis]MBY9076048.1 nucleoside triphosphate pyrophosphohydrolase [Nocardioides jiangsuensis]